MDKLLLISERVKGNRSISAVFLELPKALLKLAQSFASNKVIPGS